ncbi:hypothetical protein [Sinorhizobium meliloti]|uniref:hypothetical protein n=1 Tax=Rhizobium meliloti TaxID=382 RepID=UPI000FDA344B|nr:hypothetical protein [Sinorhizobium meliloti]RVO54939.1 hypothetical protein CN092_17980 [Sinorhizobium meliloti]
MAGVWDWMNPLKKRKLEEGQPTNLERVATPPKENFLSQFLPEDPDKREALAKALIMGGASAMAAGGPSDKPTNLLSVLGSGLAGGVGGYDESLTNAADAAYKGAAVSANALKMQQSALGQNLQEEFFKKWGAPGPGGYPPEALYDLQKMQMATGDEESARATQKQIQQLQQSGAEKGFIIGESGFQLAPGFGESLYDTKKAESLGSAVGQNAELTADVKNFTYGNKNPDFRTYEDQQAKSKQTVVNIGDPKSGDVWKAMDTDRESVVSAQNALTSIQTARQALAGATTGFGADYVLAARKAAAALGVGDTESITDTETLRAAVAPLVATILKDTAGTANLSDADRAFAEKAAGGSIELDATSIARILDIQEKVQRSKIERFKSKVNAVYPDIDGNQQNRSYFLSGIETPAPTADPDQTSSVTNIAPAKSGRVTAPVVRDGWEYFVGPDGKKYKRPVGSR